MTEKNPENSFGSPDLEGAQDYLNNLLEQQNKDEEESIKEEEKKLDADLEKLKGFADIENENDLDPKQVQKLIDFVGGDFKELDPNDLSDDDLDSLVRVSVAKMRHFNYSPKKQFGVKYKKERQRKNRQARKQRKINAKNR
jgi:uncharacterized phage infection (PIP) family protein YhgE